MKRRISLIIPLKDEEESAGPLFDSVLRQARPPDEIVVTDAGSKDKTADILNQYRVKGLPIKIVKADAVYPGIARNMAIEASTSDFIAMTDGGIILEPNWLKELEVAMDEVPDADIVYGNYQPVTDTIFKECLAIAFVQPTKIIKKMRMRPHFIASSLVRKSVWKDVGGFPPFRAAEDRIFMEKVKEKGLKVAYSPKALVSWSIPGSLKAVFNRFYSYSYHDLIAGRFSDWHVPVLKIYSVLLFLIFLAVLISPVILLLPLAAIVFRILRKIIRHKDELYFKSSRIPVYGVVTGFLIIFIDFAMFTGWVKYLLKHKTG